MRSVLLVLAAAAGALPCVGGGWYVGNTAPGEWIQYTNVWLAGAHYRFTAQAGATVDNAAFHLEIDGTTVAAGVPVPNTGRPDSFTYVPLGSTQVSQGYHNLRVVFESAGVSLDWFMLCKDNDTTNGVKNSDVTMVRPPATGMLVAPIIGYEAESDPNCIFNANDAAYLISEPYQSTNGVNYSDYQLRSWYGAPLYEDFDRRTDRYWDVTVDQLLASRAQVPFFHCRETTDFTHSLQDRDYQRGPGSYEGRWLVKFAQAVARNPQAASSLQIGMFMEDGELADVYYSTYGHYPTGWGDPTLASYAMQYWLEPWFDSVPKSLLYQPIPGRPIISIYSGTPTDLPQDGQMASFMTNICSQMEARYGLDPVFIVPMDADAGARAIAWGQAPWLTWDGPMLTMNSFNGANWGSTSAGSRRRLDTVWAADWNPITNIGTPSGDSPGDDSYQSPLVNGVSVLITNLSIALSQGTRLVQEEGFYNTSEGNRIYRSYGSGLPGPSWECPNQHLAAMSQYADPGTESLMFEAEGCDQYYKVNTHQNLGGSYRNNWYVPTGLDVYRPLQNLNAWTNQSTGPGNFVDISAGFFDVWALDASGQVWARGIANDSGEPTWTTVGLGAGAAKLTQLAVGKQFAWALNGTSVYTCQLPYGWDAWGTANWTAVSGSMVQLSVNEGDVWAVDSSGRINFMRVNEAFYPGDTWHQVNGPGPAVNKVYAGGNGKFIWAMSGSNLYYSQIVTTNINNIYTVVTNLTWTATDNPDNLTQLSIGSEEVWGINASGNIYRRAVSGAADWQAVDGNLTKLAVGENYAWGLSGSAPEDRQLSGFSGNTAPSVPGAPTGVTVTAGNSSVQLGWAASAGAAGYNIKRGIAYGGPYTNVVISTVTNGADTGLLNGTTYYYVVSAFNGIGESANSTQVSVAPAASGTVPAAPVGLTAMGTNVQVNLSWTASTGATSYNVKRSTFMGGPYTNIAASVSSTAYTDTGLAAGTVYYYVVSAVNAAGESFANSVEARATPPGSRFSRSGWVASASASSSSANLAIDGNYTTRWATGASQTPGQWFQIDLGSTNTFFKLTMDSTTNSPNDYPTGYQVNVSNDGVNWGNPVAVGTGSASLTTVIFPFETARFVRVTQTGSTGNWWSIYEFNLYSAPAVLTAPTGVNTMSGGTQVALNWNTVAGATSYNVKRSTVRGEPYTTIASTAGASFTDTGLSNSPCFYVISAANSTGESTNSSEVCGAPGALSQSGWAASASSTENIESPTNAIDGNEATPWSTGASQTAGQWFEVDLGSAQNFDELVLDAENLAGNYPRGYQVNVSNDGSKWGSPVASGSGNSAVTIITFAPQTARYIRVTQTSSGSTGNLWSIDEFNVYLTTIAIASTSPAVRVEGDLIVNLQSQDLNAGAKTWTNRTSSAQSAGNFTTEGGGNLNVASLTWNLQNVNTLNVNGVNGNTMYSASNAPAEILGAGPVSVELWIYANQVASNSDIFNYGYQAGATHASDRDFTYDQNENGFSGYFDDVGWGTTKPVAGAWEYVAYTYNGSAVNLYLNGVADGSGSVALSTLATPIELGYFSFNSASATQVVNPFTGSIACARVESGVLTTGDIATNYAAGPLGTTTGNSSSVAPPQLSVGIVGRQAQFFWPWAYLGWQLQAQTNAPGAGLGTNWVTVPNSIATNIMTFPFDSAQGDVFFRLVQPQN